MVPPKSHSTTSPARMTRSAGLVVGAGRVLAGGDDGEVHPVVALGQDAAADVGRHLGLGAPDQRDLAGLQLGRDPVGGRRRPGAAPSISAASFTARSGPVTSVARRERGARAARACSSTRNRAQVGRRWPRPARRPTRSATRSIGSSVSSHGTHGEQVGPLDHPGRLEPGHHQRGARRRGARPAWSAARAAWPRSRSATAGRAHRQQQDVDALRRHGGAHSGQAVGMHGVRLPAAPSGQNPLRWRTA